MKYLALLSGGKDSCFNLLHCARNGHELVAAASLGPEAGKEELDSYLYQTVGQDAIEFVARALDVPLFRRVITGNAVEQGSEYGSRNSKDAMGVQGDETEDLFALLSDVLLQHPEIQGVSVGAILSNYQRVRVEHVCRRLGLTPLCYLWNRDQGELLNEMINSGMEAVLIKVAGIGLTTKHLGKTLAEMQPTLVKLNSLYGAHICGEGGEYESLTLDCPLFKHRITLTEVETVIHSDNDFATVAFLRIKNATLEPKLNQSDSFSLQIPPLLEDEFIDIRDFMEGFGIVAHSSESWPQGAIETLPLEALIDKGTQSKKVGAWISVANIERTIGSPLAEISLEDEVKECFHILQGRLAEYGLNVSNCTNINIFLSSIDLFVSVNTIYATFFGSSPPARACVAVDLPYPVRVRLDCTAFEESSPTDRQALHVQSLSYWAPANIGPYSQAITAGERIFISGQIGLIPSQLSLPNPGSLATEMALASQHVARVTNVLRTNSGVNWVGHTQAALFWLADARDVAHVKEAHRSFPKGIQAPTLFLVVKALPKDALVEKQVLLHTGRCPIVDEEDDGEISIQPREPMFKQDNAEISTGVTIHSETSRFEDANSSCTIICVKGKVSDAQNATKVVLSAHNSLSIRLFYIPSRATSCISLCQSVFGESECPPITPIPCRFISTIDEDDWDFAICIIES